MDRLVNHAVFVSRTCLGILVGVCAGVDPFDQHDAASPDPMGGHGVLVAKLSQTPKMDLVKTTVAAIGQNVGDRDSRRHARSMDYPRAMARLSWW